MLLLITPYLKKDKLKKFSYKNIGSILFLLILFNASKAFIFNINYLRGVLIDYSLLKIYISDLVLVLILIAFYRKILLSKYIYIFLILGLLNLFFSINPLISFVYFIHVFILFALVLAVKKTTINLNIIIIVNVLYICVFFIQFFTDKSIFPYVPFGFYPYYGVSPNIDFFSFFGVAKVIPMANFPHANVFAGFLSFINIILIKNKKYYLFIINFFIIIFLASFSALFFNIVLLLFFVLKLKISLKQKYVFLFFYLFLCLVLMLVFYNFGFKAVSVSQRLIQLKIFLFTVKNYPMFGVGLNNYIFAINIYENFKKSVFVLQPIHNIFLLFFSEVGIFISSFLVFFIYKFKKYIKFSPYLLYVLILGLFDHYLITLNQGQIILALTILLHNSIINNSND